MIRNSIKAVVYLTAFLVLAYLFFFVPLGRRTLWEHVQRIGATDEARDLGDDLSTASERVEGAVRDKLREQILDADRIRDAGQ